MAWQNGTKCGTQTDPSYAIIVPHFPMPKNVPWFPVQYSSPPKKQKCFTLFILTRRLSSSPASGKCLSLAGMLSKPGPNPKSLACDWWTLGRVKSHWWVLVRCGKASCVRLIDVIEAKFTDGQTEPSWNKLIKRRENKNKKKRKWKSLFNSSIMDVRQKKEEWEINEGKR